MKISKKYFYLIPIIALSIVVIFIFSTFFGNFHKLLKVSFLDVGQGDSIYIEAPNGKQVLIDGGPDAKLLQSLSSVMPFADRSIDLVVVTHADSDHIGGLPLLINNYNILNILENGVSGTSKIYSTFEDKIIEKNINKMVAVPNMKIVLDAENDIYLDILFPDRDVSKFESNETSIVCRLVYGKRSFMLTGDADIYVENLIAWNEPDNIINSDILKLGHHGSKNSSSFIWLKKVSPLFAIISAGEDNRYGHPSQEVLERLNGLDIPYLATYEIGNINFETDGIKIIRN